MGGGVTPDVLAMAMGGGGDAAKMLMKNPAERIPANTAPMSRMWEKQMDPNPADLSAKGKDQSRLVNLDEVSKVPQRSPWQSGAGGMPAASDLDQPTPVKTTQIDPRAEYAKAMSKPRDAGPTQTVQGVPMSGGIMQGDPNASAYGRNATGGPFRQTGGQIDLPAGPVPAATANAMPKSPWSTETVSTPRPPQTAQGQMQPAGLPAGQGTGKVQPPGGMFGLNIPGMEEIQRTLRETPTNPLWQTGMGLLQSGADGSNPYANIMANMKGMSAHELALRSMGLKEAEGKREDKKTSDSENDAQIRAMIAQMMMAQGGGGAPARPQTVQQAQGAARLNR